MSSTIRLNVPETRPLPRLNASFTPQGFWLLDRSKRRDPSFSITKEVATAERTFPFNKAETPWGVESTEDAIPG